MSDYSELKRLAEKLPKDCSRYTMRYLAFADKATPETVAALIAENEQYSSRLHDVATLCATVEQERDQLKAENEALRKRIDDMSPLKGAPMTGPDLKCLACSGYHYGMSGLPCPKMAPMAMDGKDG